MTEFEELLLKRLDCVEKKLDDVRVTQLPQVKTDVALLIQEGRANSKLHATVGSVVAFITSTIVAIKYGR